MAVGPMDVFSSSSNFHQVAIFHHFFAQLEGSEPVGEVTANVRKQFTLEVLIGYGRRVTRGA